MLFRSGSIAEHLVNLTNPMMMKGPVREIIPSPPQTARIRLPEGARPRRVHFLVSGKPAPHRIASGVITVEVPPIGVHEVIAVDLA